jgi:hypothetical protein
MKSGVNEVRLSVPSLIMIVAVVGAGAFAAGRTMPADSTQSVAAPSPKRAETSASTEEVPDPMPPGHPATARGGVPPAELPAGHPSVDTASPTGNDPGAFPQATLQWKAPARWQLVPNASTMRIATYRIPHAAGDTVDPELSIIRAGGTVEANADRWVGQFDDAAQKGAKRSTRTVGGLQVTIVEVKGTYSGGMVKEASPTSDWVLLGAIVATPEMPHFFKLTGPAKSVAAARAEFDAFVGSFAPR